jgi:hypothetical protein
MNTGSLFLFWLAELQLGSQEWFYSIKLVTRDFSMNIMSIKNNNEYCTNEPCMALHSCWLKSILQIQAVWLTDLRFLNNTETPDCYCL